MFTGGCGSSDMPEQYAGDSPYNIWITNFMKKMKKELSALYASDTM